MKNIVLTLQYDGTRYSGWQRQGNTDNTIETKVTRALAAVLECDEKTLELHGSGRTDAGVHAEGQVANVHIDTELEPAEIMKELNALLPEDIRVLRAEEKDGRFHSRLNAVEKTYIYRIDNGAARNVFMRKYAYYHSGTLDLDKMRRVAAVFTGEHDFKSFTDMKNKKKSTVRFISDIDIKKDGDLITIAYTGNGFLYHMVRLLTGTLIKCGEGELTVSEVQTLLDKKEKQPGMPLAPAQGLTLYSVGYYQTTD
jgi:tRNA pseudouridine38-40 synthase